MRGGSTRHLSYTDQKLKRRRFLRTLFAALLVFTAYGVLTGLFLTPYRIVSASMTPGLNPGDRVIASPAALGRFNGRLLPGFRPLKRGDLVLVDPPYAKRPRGFSGAVDAVLRFLSFQTLGLGGTGADPAVVKRVIGLPGDRLGIKGFRASIKPAAQAHYLSEEELSQGPYDLIIPRLPDGWDGSLPFSGEMEEISLGEGEYFVMSDDRGAFHDSRSWGPIGPESIRGLILVRYWPLASK